jgi:Domain of unknown function (DUF4124)
VKWEICLGFCLALATASLSSHAENTYYRWNDERGNPVHSDRPPAEGIEYEVVSTGSNLIRKVGAEEGAVPASTDPVPGNEFDPVKASGMDQPKKNPEYCKRAQDNLATLNSSARIRTRNKEGEYRFLDEDEIATEKAKALEAVAVHCR